MVKHQIGLQKLRSNVIEALKATAPTESNTCVSTQLEAWINGFGEVVEAGLLPSFPHAAEYGLSATDCKDRLYNYKMGSRRMLYIKRCTAWSIVSEIFEQFTLSKLR
jgi:hypothetical protein